MVTTLIQTSAQPDADCAIAGHDETLLSLAEYHALVKKLALDVEELEKSNGKLQGERDLARHKLKIQRHLITHLRARLEVVTGLDLHAGDEALVDERPDRRPLSLGRAVKRLRTDRIPDTETASADTLPAIDPAEFLPITETDSPLLRRIREVVGRCRSLGAACVALLDQPAAGAGVSGRLRT